jgi:hypothetical protein
VILNYFFNNSGIFSLFHYFSFFERALSMNKSILDKWEYEAKNIIEQDRGYDHHLPPAEFSERILALIGLIRKKDQVLRQAWACLGTSYDWSDGTQSKQHKAAFDSCKEALALTDKLGAKEEGK